MSENLKIAVIGNPDTVIGFKALGLETYPATEPAEARDVLKKLTAGEETRYAVIYIEEALAIGIQDEIDRFKDSPLPAVIVIPGPDGSMGTGMAALNSAVERAVGMNIL